MRDRNLIKLQRLFVETPLAKNGHLILKDNQFHYVHNVMRLKIGDKIRVFNGKDGEYLAEISHQDKKELGLALIEQTTPQITPRFLGLIFAPLKGDRMHFVIEKSTELGITHFLPVLTERTIVRSINLEKQPLSAIEAAEQSELLYVPRFAEPSNLFDLISSLQGIILFFDELADSLTSHIHNRKLDNVDLYILVGPEGGFSEKERSYIKNKPNVISASLGNRALRSETAIISAISYIYLTRGI